MLLDVDQSKSTPRVTVGAEGGTDLKEMMTHLKDDSIQYGAFKVLGVDTRGAVTSTCVEGGLKCCCGTQWCGEPHLKRPLLGGLCEGCAKHFAPHQCAANDAWRGGVTRSGWLLSFISTHPFPPPPPPSTGAPSIAFSSGSGQQCPR